MRAWQTCCTLSSAFMRGWRHAWARRRHRLPGCSVDRGDGFSSAHAPQGRDEPGRQSAPLPTANSAPGQTHAMPTQSTRKAAPKRKPGKPGLPAEVRLSRTRRPQGLEVADWQTALRRQFGREQAFDAREPGQRAGVLRLPRAQPAKRHALPRGHPRPSAGRQFLHLPRLRDQRPGHLQAHRVHARTPGQAARRQGGVGARFRARRTARSGSTTPARGVCVCAPATGCPAELLAQRAAAVRRRRRLGLALGPPRRAPATCCARRPAAATSCAATTMSWQFVAQIRDGERRLATLAEAYPKGVADKALAQAAEGQALSLSGRGRAVRRARRPRADRRRDGPGQDHPGHRRGRTVRAPLRRAACAGGLPDLAQAPVAEASSRASPSARRRSSAACAPSARSSTAKTSSARSPTTKRSRAMLDLIDAWAPELVIVDEAQRIKNWNTIAARALKRIDSPYAIVLTGTPLENRLEELISIVQFVDQHRLGPTWRLLDEHQQARRGRARDRLPRPGPHRPDAGAGHAAPAQGRGADAAARARGQPHASCR